MNRLWNSGKMMLFAFTVFLIFSFVQNGFAQNNGESLAEKVTGAITSRYAPSSLQVNMKDDRWIILTGETDLLYKKDRIYETASHVKGVKRITNDIQVDPQPVPEDRFPDNITDDQIKQNVEALIGENAAIDQPQNIKVDVENNLVELSGKVDFYREKMLAETVASQVRGVKAIDNNIKVVPVNKALTDQNIKDVLVSILDNEFPLVSKNDIGIKVNNGFVTVTGSVSDLWTKNNIAKEFSSIEGVIEVVNKIKVNPEMNS